MDPTARMRILADLKARVATMPLRMAQAAKYVIDHPVETGLDPVRETARKAQVSTYTLVKLAKTLGFEGYDAFRAPFRHALAAAPAEPGRPGWPSDLRARGRDGVVMADAIENGLALVRRSLERQSLEALETAADALIAAPRVFVTAVRSSYALAYYLHYVGRMALPGLELVPRHQSSAIDDLADAGAGDVLIAITVSPYSRETIEACRFAAQKGMKIMMITDSEMVVPGLEPTATLAASVVSTHRFACFSGMTAVIEVLLALLIERAGGAAQARISSYEALRDAHSAFWPAKKT